MWVEARAPMRLGLAGGGTDVSPYCDRFGGSVVNATVSLYAHARVEWLEVPVVELEAVDRGEREVHVPYPTLPPGGGLDLLKGVYHRFVADHGFPGRGLRITTRADVPAGSGLGTSSTLVVALVRAFLELYGLRMDAYEVARLAYRIEREDLGLPGGRQDQFAAAFGGVNQIRFQAGERVEVVPLAVKDGVMAALEERLVLYYTGRSRDATAILAEQCRHATEEGRPLEAMHRLKEQSRMMGEALLAGRLDEIGEILDYGFRQKREMASGISHPGIEAVYDAACAAGATGGKISGAGGGGFMVFYCPPGVRGAVEAVLAGMGGRVYPFRFVREGVCVM
jgi:D-glycero-alpha-D-manno-heptose-7-phosphate kinase